MWTVYQAKIDLNFICRLLNYTIKEVIKDINLTLISRIIQPKNIVHQVQDAIRL